MSSRRSTPPRSQTVSFRPVQRRARAHTEPPFNSSRTRVYSEYTLRSFKEYKNTHGSIAATYALYRKDEQQTWYTHSTPLVNGANAYIEYIINKFVQPHLPLTHQSFGDLKDFLDNKVLCYAATVDVQAKKFYGYWAKIEGFRYAGSTLRYPHFDFLEDYRVIEYSDDINIPIGRLCIPPYHLGTSPLYLEKFLVARIGYRTRRLHKKLEPAEEWTGEVVDLTSDTEESNAAASAPASPAPLPVPAPIEEDGYPAGSDA